jgi:hypothetical protein
MASAICEVDALELSRRFNCGPACTAGRRSDLVHKLSGLRSVVRDFDGLAGVQLISQWGIVGEYRVNDVYVMMGQVVESSKSNVMGFVPSDSWTQIADVGTYFKRARVSSTQFMSVLRRIKELSLTAVIRENFGVRVVLVGIGNRESGLLFLKREPKNLPRSGERAGDGRRYVLVEQLEKDIVFYETD